MDSTATTIVPSITFMAHLGEGHHVQAFDIAVASRQIPHVRRRHLAMRPFEVPDLERLGLTVEGSADTHGGRIVNLNAGVGELVEIVATRGSGSVRVAAPTIREADGLLERVCTALAEQERPEDLRVPVWFWTLSDHGPHPIRRRLKAPAWEEIAPNYAPAVRTALEEIMTGPADRAQGIALWRGAPGTGKTTALRALARAWKEQCELHVIIDPEVFLGDKASYLVDVLFGGMGDWDDDDGEEGDGVYTQGLVVSNVGMAYPSDVTMSGAMLPGAGPIASHEMDMMAAELDRERRRPRAKLVVLEDAGELIAADARVSSGQALSRLLNLTDGMLGQGSNVSVLVTTNEPIDRLHPAVARPGRGWAHVEFRTLGVEDANAWLLAHGSNASVAAPSTIAELYALLQGGAQVVTLDDLSD